MHIANEGSVDSAIWSGGSQTLFIFIHLEKNRRRRPLYLILIPLYSRLSVFSLTLRLPSRSESIQSHASPNKHNLAVTHGSYRYGRFSRARPPGERGQTWLPNRKTSPQDSILHTVAFHWFLHHEGNHKSSDGDLIIFLQQDIQYIHARFMRSDVRRTYLCGDGSSPCGGVNCQRTASPGTKPPGVTTLQNRR